MNNHFHLLRETTVHVLRPGGFLLTDQAVEQCGFRPGDKILDVGCGFGATVNRLRTIYRLDAAGIDPGEELLAIGRSSYPSLPLSQGQGEDIPFADQGLDGVFAECSLSLMSDMKRALQEMHRVLKPGGRLVVHDVYARDPQGIKALQELNINSCLRQALARDSLEACLNECCFRIDLWQDQSPLLTQLAMQLIMTHGSMQEFWLKSTECSADPDQVQAAMKKAKVGYFQLIATKI